MAQFVNDTFTDTNGTALTSHTSEGTTWTRRGSGGSAAGIQNNAVNAPDSLDLYTASNSPAGANYSVTATLKYKSTSTSPYVGVVFGWADANNYYWAGWDGWYTAPVNRWRIFKVVGGTRTEIGVYNSAPAVNDIVTIEAGRNGSSVYLKINGTERITGSTDAGITGNGSAGLSAFGSTPTDGSNGIDLQAISADDIAGSSITLSQVERNSITRGLNRGLS
jgi:hypothetical protein